LIVPLSLHLMVWATIQAVAQLGEPTGQLLGQPVPLRRLDPDVDGLGPVWLIWRW